MFHDHHKTAFTEIAPVADSPLRRAMMIGAMFGTAAQGAMPLPRALAALRQEADARTVTQVRVVRHDKTYLVATTAAQHLTLDPVAATFAKTLDDLRGALEPGRSVRNALDRDQRGIVLHLADSYLDLVIVDGGDPMVLADFAAVAAPIWAMRRDGLAINAITALQSTRDDSCKGRTADVVQGCILSARNPAGLTPTEFRVALALRDGRSPATIAQDLAIAMPTVRTHLRNLYAKTGLRGMHELTHRLHGDAAA